MQKNLSHKLCLHAISSLLKDSEIEDSKARTPQLDDGEWEPVWNMV